MWITTRQFGVVFSAHEDGEISGLIVITTSVSLTSDSRDEKGKLPTLKVMGLISYFHANSNFVPSFILFG